MGFWGSVDKALVKVVRKGIDAINESAEKTSNTQEMVNRLVDRWSDKDIDFLRDKASNGAKHEKMAAYLILRDKE